MIDDPPVPLAEKLTDACALSAVTEDMLGACGTVVAVTALLADDAEDVPYKPVAVAVYVYCVLDCKPVIIRGLVVPVAVYEPGLEVIV